MRIFTYNDYIKSIHSIKRYIPSGLAEEGATYNLISTKQKNTENKKENIKEDLKGNIKKGTKEKIEDKIHDKLIKEILKEKKEVVDLINKFLKPKEYILEENIEKYTNSYITKKYKSKEADIVYKLNDKDIFFLVEHQSTIDSNMPYRILNYCIEIVQEWKKEQKNKVSKYPVVVPTVIYTGQKKWNVPKNYKEQQIKVTTFEEYRIDLQYNLIDVNSYSIKELLEKGTMLSYSLIMEKSKDNESFIKNIKLILEKEKNKKRLNKIWDITIHLFGNILEEKDLEEIFKIIDEKVGEKDMESLVQRIREGEAKKMRALERKAEKKGREKAKQEIVTKIKSQILKLNESDKTKQILNNILNNI